jgi:hypothetical protein
MPVLPLSCGYYRSVTCATLIDLYSLANADVPWFCYADCFKVIISAAILREALQHL